MKLISNFSILAQGASCILCIIGLKSVVCHWKTVILLMLILCGNIETNPGPRTALAEIFPCTYCDLPVNYGEKALCCDECSVWLYKSCLCMKTTAYDKLELDADSNWYCLRCRTKNSSLYHSYEYTVATQNSFSVLSSIPEDDVFASPTNSRPIAQSSPVSTHTVPKAASVNSSLGSTSSSTDTGTSSKSTQEMPHKGRNWRSLVVNINGIRGKIACIENLIDHTKPDAIMINETKLPPDIGTPEIIPGEWGYTVHRKDRPNSDGGKGLLHFTANPLQRRSRNNLGWGASTPKPQIIPVLSISPTRRPHRPTGILRTIHQGLHAPEQPKQHCVHWGWFQLRRHRLGKPLHQTRLQKEIYAQPAHADPGRLPPVPDGTLRNSW